MMADEPPPASCCPRTTDGTSTMQIALGLKSLI